MNVSIKQRICGSFMMLVFLFIANGIASFITLNNNRKLSEYVAAVSNPSLQCLEDFKDLLIASKMYTTNRVFLRSSQADIDSLKHLNTIIYPRLKVTLNQLSAKWYNKDMRDSLNKIYNGFEQLIAVEQRTMLSLQKFDDYNDPSAKLQVEILVKEEFLPRTSSLINALSGITLYELKLRNQKNKELEKSFNNLKIVISVFALAIVLIGIFLSLYMTRIIINPINKIRDILNDLGKGAIRKVHHKISKNEIGEMVRSVNNLSEKLRVTAAFATEVGNKNFNSFFEPLSSQDTLGLALITMRDSIKLSDTKLNDAQHIAHIGSWERDIKTDKLTFSDEMFNIFDIDRKSFDFKFQSILNLIHSDDKEFVMGMRKKNLQSVPEPYDCRIITSKGTVKNIFINTKVIADKNGEVEKTFGVVQDITERKRNEEKLAEEKELFRLVIEKIPDQIYLKDAESRFILCNMPVANIAGCKSPVEMIGKSDFDFVPDDLAKQFFKEEKAIIQTGISLINHEQSLTDKVTGESRWYLSTKFPLKNNAGNVIGLIGINRDITERKIAEKQLEDANRELNILFNSIDEIFFSVNMITSKVIQISPTCEKIYGYEQVEFMNNHRLWFDLIFPDDRHIVSNEDEIMQRGQQVSNEYRIVRKDKSIRWVETRITPTLDENKILIRVDGVTRDITERKNVEQALKESESFNKGVLASLSSHIAVINANGLVVAVNKAWEDFSKANGETRLSRTSKGSNYFDVCGKAVSEGDELARHALNGVTSVLKKEISMFELEYPCHSHNEQRWFMLRVVNFESDSPKAVLTHQDITGRKKAEAQLKKSEEQYRQIVETAEEGILLGDENNRIIFVNKKMAEILEYTAEEMVGKKDKYFMHDKEFDFALQIADEAKQRIKATYEVKFITKSGTHVWAYISSNPVFSEEGIYKGSLAMVTDITKRKLDDELLQKSQHNLEANNRELERKNKELEQFAYVASHDLQEPLRTTISFVKIFKQQYFGKIDAKSDKYLTYITQASDRMRVLIKDLLDFSRIGNNKNEEQVDCNIILQDVTADIGKAINESGAEIKAEYLPVVSGYATELKQLFQNLIINAIKFRKKDIPPKISITAHQKNDYWRFAFTDNGIGIDQQHNERIFIIFQRLHTRTEYQGSGIGLSHCKKIVELHHGKIWVESTPNKGSTFYFTIHSPKEKINEPKIKLHNVN